MVIEMRILLFLVAGVRLPCVTLAELVRIVFIAAFVWFLCRSWESCAGGMLMSVFVLVGAMAILGGRARRRPFWCGFEAVGVPLFVAYLVAHRFLFAGLVFPWTNFVFRWIDLWAAKLPAGAFHVFRQYFYINRRGALTPAEIVVLQEVSFGLPMLVLGAAGGLVAVRLSRPRSQGSASPDE